jgi:polyhydroxyalkanoate synthase
MRLRIYGAGEPGPLLLIVPAPIKRAYIWDLMPGRSVVRHAIRSGFGVGLIEWTEPERNGTCRDLDDYAHRLIGLAVEAMSTAYGGRELLLAGHSLGGTLAAIFATVQPEKVRGLVLVEAPLHFGPGGGALGSLLSIAPWTPEATRASHGPMGLRAPRSGTSAHWSGAILTGVSGRASCAGRPPRR